VRKLKPRRIPLDLHSLNGRVDIFRLSGAAERDAAVELWFANDPNELKSIAHAWFAEMRRCGEDVRELMHDGCPVACVEDAPFAYVNAYRSHVDVGFFYGAMLEDPSGILEGGGRRMRHVKLQPGGETDAKALRGLIRAAFLDIRARLAREPAPR
jgi:hypothetical protein